MATKKTKKIEAPNESTVKKAFYESNPCGVTNTLMQLNVMRVHSQSQVHKRHVDYYACNIICRITKDRAFHLTKKTCTLTSEDFAELEY